MKKAALYLRSSKDRSDVSIDSQRRELQALASERGYTIVAEFCDVVESAKSEHRPGFQHMIRELRSASRPWEAILVVDTSRLSRGVYVAHAFNHECEKRGVQIVYSKLPDLDPITRVVIHSVFQAMDEVHSLMSREKGLAGMAENVKQGYRAGGRAPRGYRLAKVETGAFRDGKPVTKSVLEPDELAPALGRYLSFRAQGKPRSHAARLAGIELPKTTLVTVDWNALTYAGATVWNVHNERQADGGYKGGTKRRPRSEWVIQKDTHPPLITWDEAEAILQALERSAHSRSGIMRAAKTANTPYLLTGLVTTPDGDPWYGNGGKHYRTQRKGKKNRWVSLKELEGAVTAQIMVDMRSERFASSLAKEARLAIDTGPTDPARELRAQVSQINDDIQKAMKLALRLADPAPALETVDELNRKRKTLTAEISAVDDELAARKAVAGITTEQVQGILREIANELTDRSRLKELIREFVEKIVLDPETLDCSIHYRFEVKNRESMASPRGFEPLSPP